MLLLYSVDVVFSTLNSPQPHVVIMSLLYRVDVVLSTSYSPQPHVVMLKVGAYIHDYVYTDEVTDMAKFHCVVEVFSCQSDISLCEEYSKVCYNVHMICAWHSIFKTFVLQQIRTH